MSPKGISFVLRVRLKSEIHYIIQKRKGNMQLEDPCTNLRDSVDAAPHAEENESPSTKNRADSIMDISSDESKSPINKCKSNCRKKKVKSPWTPEEDAVLLKLVADEGHSVKW